MDIKRSNNKIQGFGGKPRKPYLWTESREWDGGKKARSRPRFLALASRGERDHLPIFFLC